MKYCLMTLSAILLFVACNKKPVNTTGPEDILRTGKWKLASGTLTVKNPNGKDTTLDYMKFILDCYKDDYFKFDSLHNGKIYYGTVNCNAGDPEYRSFQWKLTNDGTTMDWYNGLNWVFAVVDTIQPYKFDTLVKEPLELDTLVGRLDTLEGQWKIFIVLDTIRELKYSGIPIGQYQPSLYSSGFDINRAAITDLTQAGFTLNFQIIGTRLDSTNYHAGPPNNFAPLEKLDTLRYKLKFSNF